MSTVRFIMGLLLVPMITLNLHAKSRSCHARYAISVESGGKRLTSKPIALKGFTARRGCASNPNQCRRRARDSAHSCMAKHALGLKGKVPSACGGPVKGYPFTNLHNTIKKRACILASALGQKKAVVKLIGETWGDRGCGKTATLSKKLKYDCQWTEKKAPTSVKKARAQFSLRRHKIVQVWLTNMANAAKANKGNWQKAIGDFDSRGGIESFRRIAAGLYALKRKRETKKSFRNMPPAHFPKIVEKWSATIAKRRVVGTQTDANCKILGKKMKKALFGGTCEGDYDFHLKEMVALLHEFKNDRKELTDKTVVNIIKRGLRDDMGTEFGEHMAVTAAVLGTIPETENHVLMIYGSQYLINDYILANPRNLAELRKGVFRDRNKFRNKGTALEDFLLQAAARPLYAGFFETNARPYQSKTFHAMLNLAEYSTSRTMRVAFKNALDYLATKYAFQSFQGQRFTPARRNHKTNYTHNFRHLDTDGMQLVMAVLSSANPNIPLVGHGNAGGHALWAALSSYRLPAPIHDYMLNKRNGYWATMHARYSDRHYKIHSWPRYFHKNGKYWGNPRQNERAQEAYFATPQFMNVSGGFYERYKVKWDTLDIQAGAKPLDFLAMPQVLLTPGLLHNWPGLGELTQETIAMPGEHARWYKSANSGTYKSFSYGYFHRDKKQRHLSWPQRVPPTWDSFLYREGNQLEWPVNKGRAMFRFYDFTRVKRAVAGIPAGIYLVFARVSKNANTHTHRHYARGFWEVVPKHRFVNTKALKTHVLKHNPASHFSNATKGSGKPYKYRMTNGDLLTLEDIIGNPNINRCYSPIISVASGGRIENLKAKRCDPETRAKVPLLRVEEIDPKTYRSTGNLIALANGDGLLKVFNRHLRRGFVLDSRQYRTPARRVLTKPIKDKAKPSVVGEKRRYRCDEGKPSGARNCKVARLNLKSVCRPGKTGCPYWIDTVHKGIFRGAIKKKGKYICREGTRSGARNCLVARVNFKREEPGKCRSKQGRKNIPKGCSYWIDTKYKGVFKRALLRSP